MIDMSNESLQDSGSPVRIPGSPRKIYLCEFLITTSQKQYFHNLSCFSKKIDTLAGRGLRPSPKLWCRKDPGHIYQLLEKLSSWLPGVTSYDQFCLVLFRFKKWSPGSGSRTGSSAISISIWENYREVSWMVKLFEFFNTVVILPQMSVQQKIKPSPATPAYYSCEHAHSRHISSTSHSPTRPRPKLWCRKDPGHIYQLLEKLTSWPPGVTSYDQFCLLLFRFKKWSPGSESKTGSSAISISILVAPGWRLKPEGVRSTLSYAKSYSELILMARWFSYEILKNCNFWHVIVDLQFFCTGISWSSASVYI